MATLHFVKPGRKPNGDRVTTDHQVNVADIAKLFPTTKASWSIAPPTFGVGHVTSDYESYQHVVLEVEATETYGHFDKPGFFTLEGITPKMVAEKLDLRGPGT